MKDELRQAALLPCPFCGSGEVSQSTGMKGDGTPWLYIECHNCASSGEPEWWNRRAALEHPQPEPVGKLIRGEGGAFRYSYGDCLLAVYATSPGEHALYTHPAPAPFTQSVNGPTEGGKAEPTKSTKENKESAKEAEPSDTARLDWLDAGGDKRVVYVSGTWYSRAGFRKPCRKHDGLRAAIDAAMKGEQHG